MEFACNASNEPLHNDIVLRGEHPANTHRSNNIVIEIFIAMRSAGIYKCGTRRSMGHKNQRGAFTFPLFADRN
jgi:hypothetical protein